MQGYASNSTLILTIIFVFIIYYLKKYIIGYECENQRLRSNYLSEKRLNSINSLLKINRNSYYETSTPSIPKKPIQHIFKQFQPIQLPSTLSSTKTTTTTIQPKIIESSSISTTSITPLTSSTIATRTVDESQNNGSFVLVVNLDPNEFRRRKTEIVTEFERRFGILMLIKKEPNSQNDMIYPIFPRYE